MTTTNYIRVLPRDLFNESKLLKCLGQLALYVHDGIDNKRQSVSGLTIEHDGEAFEICQNQDDGGLYCANLIVYANGERLDLKSPYNCKSPYPLECETYERGVFDVFNDDGSLSDDFIAILQGASI